MVAKLEAADKTSRFPRFTQLPPELREMIYLYAMDNKARVRPASPPISRTNSLIRRESLPVFFKNTTLNIHVFCGPRDEPLREKGSLVVRSKDEDKSLQMSRDYREYFEHACEQGWFRHMRRFQWYVGSHVRVVVPGGLKRERTEKFQLVLTTDAKAGRLTSEHKKFGRVEVRELGIFEAAVCGKGKAMAKGKGKFEDMVNWFMETYDNPDLKKG